jgi:hypothetical protein
MALPSCVNTAGKSVNRSALVNVATNIGARRIAEEHLAKATTAEGWEERHARLAAIQTGLQVINGGFMPETVRALVVTEIAGNPKTARFAVDGDVLDLLDLLMALAPSSDVPGLQNAFIKSLIGGLETALAAPMPDLPNAEK